MKIRYSKQVVKDVKKIKDKKVIERITQVIHELKKAERIEEINQIKKLKGHPTAYRIRIGDYRLGLFIENEIVELARLVKRNDIYKLFP